MQHAIAKDKNSWSPDDMTVGSSDRSALSPNPSNKGKAKKGNVKVGGKSKK
jgi:hypothetical protein